MPTGYTAKLESINYDVLKWLTQDIPRAMGMYIMLRDDSSDMTMEEIREKISNETSTYYEESLTRDTLELETLKKMSQQQWEDNLKETVQEDISRVRERRSEWLFKKEKHLESLQKVTNLINKATDKTTKDILGFAKQQLDLVVTSEYDASSEPKITDCDSYKSWKKYKNLRIEMVSNSVDYNRKRIFEQNEKTKERLEAFDTYTKFVQNLKDTL